MEKHFDLECCSGIMPYNTGSRCEGNYTIMSGSLFIEFTIHNELPEYFPKQGKYSESEILDLEFLPNWVKSEIKIKK